MQHRLRALRQVFTTFVPSRLWSCTSSSYVPRDRSGLVEMGAARSGCAWDYLHCKPKDMSFHSSGRTFSQAPERFPRRGRRGQDPRDKREGWGGVPSRKARASRLDERDESKYRKWSRVDNTLTGKDGVGLYGHVYKTYASLKKEYPLSTTKGKLRVNKKITAVKEDLKPRLPNPLLESNIREEGERFNAKRKISRSGVPRSRDADDDIFAAPNSVSSFVWVTKPGQKVFLSKIRMPEVLAAIKDLPKLRSVKHVMDTLKIDSYSFRALLDGLRRQKTVDRCVEVFHWAEEQELIMTSHHYVHILSIYKERREWQKAFELFAKIKERGAHKDIYIFSTMISICNKAKKSQWASTIFDEMIACGIEPNVVTYSSLISACANGATPQSAVFRFQQMLELNIEPNSFTISAYFTACEKGYMWPEALEMYRSINNGTYDVAMTNHMYSALFSAAVMASDPAEVQPIYHQMRSSGFVADLVTYSAALTCHISDLDMCLQIHTDMMGAGIKPTTWTYSALMQACAPEGRWDKAQELLFEMESKGLQPNEFTLNALILTSYGDWERAKGFYEWARSRLPRLIAEHTADKNGVIGLDNPFTPIYNAFIDQCYIAGHEDEAQQVFQDMIDDGIRPSQTTGNIMLSHIWESDRHRAVEFHQQLGVYKPVFFKSKHLKAIDLHSMSQGSAAVSLSLWILELHEQVKATGDLQGMPELLGVITGHRNRRPGEPVLKSFVPEFLEGLGAPFAVDSGNEGQLLASRKDVATWLRGVENIRETLFGTAKPERGREQNEK
ncbi:hypothetical protein CYMTET_48510 [Cymbomonas tetramitiformis]|uniref:PROP1-like PPR domain-containing protein n=1 Tax=Cymbomonas tetramitiformis TaxID=36881 RepID=A0AAE0BTD7_9CHLO|nr:hypothetical protein CYMTET_48510 [Cymbomonas tetramitiformis]